MSGQEMGTGRLEAFSDGVVAIIITIMVLELKVPQNHDPVSLLALWPVFLSYVLSFLVIAIYWVNHHNLIHHVRRVDTALLWSNIFWLFCISLIPFATAYMGENRFSSLSTALYAGTLLLAGVSYVPIRICAAAQAKDAAAYEVLWRRAARKNYLSLALYLIAVPMAFVHPAITMALCFTVSGIYFLPNAWLGEKKRRS